MSAEAKLDDLALLEQENKRLGRELQDARAELENAKNGKAKGTSTTNLHTLLLLSDSALPLGSFAFSSGLESFLAHKPKRLHDSTNLKHFLDLSLASITASTLPFVLAGYLQPNLLPELDNDLDASTTCVVAKRASVKQGRALVALWDRSFKLQSTALPDCTAVSALSNFSSLLKDAGAGQSETFAAFAPSGHLPPVFGVTCKAMGLPVKDTLYLFIFNHAKTVLSAGIRASVIGPYQVQGILASDTLKDKLIALVDTFLNMNHWNSHSSSIPDLVERAGQHVPCLDLWGGRHEIVYSRVFNS